MESKQATTEARFQAAVNVIKGLPKDGPYQPSTTMMLKFYGLYKQATEGPCKQKKPSFWDVVGKAKWGAWNDNRYLSREQAMERYVDGLREIIETMSFTENVQNFVGSLNGLENINLDELEMIMPGMRELAESHPSSPFNSRTNSPQHGSTTNGTAINQDSTQQQQQLNSGMNGYAKQLNGHASPSSDDDDDNDDEDEEEHDGSTTTATTSTTLQPIYNNNVTNAIPNGYPKFGGTFTSGDSEQSDDEYADPVDMNHELTQAINQNSVLLQQIQATVLRMNADLVLLNQRMQQLEKSNITNQRNSSCGGVSRRTEAHSSRAYPKWWPFNDISPAWFTLLVLWPFLASGFSRMLANNRAMRRKCVLN